MALAVNTPTHLREIGLLPEKKNDYESEKEDIAYLFHVALQKVGSKFRLSFGQNLPIIFLLYFLFFKKFSWHSCHLHTPWIHGDGNCSLVKLMIPT